MKQRVMWAVRANVGQRRQTERTDRTMSSLDKHARCIVTASLSFAVVAALPAIPAADPARPRRAYAVWTKGAADAALAPDGTIYVAWQTSRYPACVVGDSDCTSIVYSKSVDGISWTPPAAVASVQGSPMTGAHGILEQPQIAFAADGTVGVMFYDHENSPVPNRRPPSRCSTRTYGCTTRATAARRGLRSTSPDRSTSRPHRTQSGITPLPEASATSASIRDSPRRTTASSCPSQTNPTLALPHNTDIYFARVRLWR